MANGVSSIFHSAPEIAVFLSLGLGYLVGKVKFGSFALGATAGTLLVALGIGIMVPDLQVAPPLLKAIFFALFIFAVGFRTGPQFFQSFDRKMIKQIVLTVVVTVAGLLCVLIGAKVLGLDAGMAAGLGAGGLTQSAIIGTAGDAIGRLGLDAEKARQLQSNVAIGYAVTYVFGTIGIIFVARDIAPRILGINLKAASEKYESELSAGRAALKPGQFNANLMRNVRAFTVEQAAGKTVEQAEREIGERCFVEFLRRGDGEVEVTPSLVLERGDVVLMAGTIAGLMAAAPKVGAEVAGSKVSAVGEALDVVITRKEFIGKTIAGLNNEASRGVFLRRIVRGGAEVPIRADFTLKRGDTFTLVGNSRDVVRVGKLLGTLERPSEKTDLLYCGIGIVLGTLIGLISIPIAGIPVTLGAGGGVLVAGLVFGWLRSLHPTFGNFPGPVQAVFSDLGLNGFIAVVGLAAGPSAVSAIKNTGVGLFIAGIGVTLIPAFIGLYLGKWMKMDPVVLIGALCGARSANPAIGAVTDQAESSAPAVGFTVPYAIANVLLTVWGPVIVGIMH